MTEDIVRDYFGERFTHTGCVRLHETRLFAERCRDAVTAPPACTCGEAWRDPFASYGSDPHSVDCPAFRWWDRRFDHIR